MRKFRIGIAGYDLWPHTLAFIRTLRDAEFCEITAVWDEDATDRKLLVGHTGARAFVSLDEFVSSEIDGGILTVRTSERARVCKALAAAGKHVLADKPMAMTVEECSEMITACERSGVALFSGFNFRFWKTFSLMKKIWDSGELGDPHHIMCSYPTGMPSKREDDKSLTSWWTDPEATPGGAWFTHADHAIDFARWLFQTEVAEVTADMRKLRYAEFETEDYGVAHFVLVNGATLLIHSDGISPGVRSRLDLNVYGTKGGMTFSWRPESILRVWTDDSSKPNVTEYHIADSWDIAMREMTRSWIDGATRGTDPEVTGLDGLRVMEASLAAYEASEKHTVVKLRESEGIDGDTTGGGTQ